MGELKLGEEVCFSVIVERKRTPWDSKETPRKTWLERKTIPPTSGILTGVRTLQEGEIHGGGYDDDDPPHMVHKNSVKVGLVVTSLYRNPVKVPIAEMVTKQ